MTETNQEVTPSSPSPDLSEAHQIALIERIVASSHFRRATRLRDFLLFVGNRSIRNGQIAIHEQEIGAAVFERPEVYDTTVDNIVRVNATELRKRLELYFSSEGEREPVVIEMPRGSYMVQFRARAAFTPAAEVAAAISTESAIEHERPSEAAPLSSPTTSAVSQRIWNGKLWPAVSLVLLLAVSFLLWRDWRFQRDTSPWRDGPALRAFWSEFLGSGQEVDIVLADTSFALAEDMEGRSIPLNSYLNYDYKRVETVAGLSADRREDVQSALNRNNGSAGDFIVAQRILALDHSTKGLKLTFAREYSSEAIKTNSVVLIGSRESNPWVELFSNRMNFSVEYDPVHHQSSIRNQRPAAGEQPIYMHSGDTSHEHGLSVIAFIPDLSHTGSALIIQGTDSQATRAAGEFVTSEATLAAFLDRLGSKRFPYFEILLENSQLAGTPLRSQILAYRTYPITGEAAVTEGAAVGAPHEKER